MRQSPIQLSAAVMVYNGMQTIKRCLDDLVAACDEVVVVDDCSTDGTWEYLQSRSDIRAVQHRHMTFASQREYAKSLTSGTWVLTMDADEFVSADFARTIRRAISAPHAPDGFYLRHATPFPVGLRGTYWGWHARLIRSDKCRWVVTDNPHSPLDKRGLRLKKLRGGWLQHAPLPSVAACLRKSINRNLILAAQLRARGRKSTLLRLSISTILRFCKVYTTTGVWRYGRDGIAFSLLSAFEPYAKYLFLYGDEAVESMAASLDHGVGAYPKGAPVVVRTQISE